MTREALQNGQIFLIDKPKHWSSTDVLRKMQSITDYRKFGHAGTLDPLATGLLIVCSGRATKLINEIQHLIKTYEVEFILGGETVTYDAEFPPFKYTDTSTITLEILTQEISRNFTGNIIQQPPIFSAKKVNGTRAYKSARKGKLPIIKPNQVQVDKFNLFEMKKHEIDGVILQTCKAVITCSKGTYIRSLIHDLGQNLGVGGYIIELKRTTIGIHKLENALTIEKLEKDLT
jgi:tRNA pseudouridine55 synthase